MLYLQPQGNRQLDRNNSLTEGLEFAFVPEKAPLRGLRNDKYLDFFGDGQSFTLVNSPNGLALSNNNSNFYRIETSASTRVQSKTGFTTLTICTPRLANTANNIIVNNDDGSGWQAAALQYGNGTNSRFTLRYSGAGSLSATSDAVLGKQVSVCAVSGLTQQKLFIDGQLNASVSAAIGNALFLRGPTLRSPSSTPGTILFHLCLVWARALTDAEVKQISDNPWQVFADDQDYTFLKSAVVSLPTIARPSSDVAAGGWVSTEANLYSAIGEAVPNNATFISTTSTEPCEIGLSETLFPGGSAQKISYQSASDNGSTLTVTLKQGATTIMTRSHALSPTMTLYEQTLTAGEIALISAGAISVTLAVS